MGKIKESGYPIQIENAKKLKSFIDSCGATYAPSNAAITQVSLQAAISMAITAYNAYYEINREMHLQISERERLFKPFETTLTDVKMALRSCGAAEEIIADAELLFASLSYKSKSKPKKSSVQAPADSSPTNNATIGSEERHNRANISFSKKVEVLKKLVLLLGSEPTYKPNETRLSLPVLNDTLAALAAKNTLLNDTAILLNNARYERDKLFYNTDTGLIDICRKAKAYIKSIYGSNSYQAKGVTTLTFRKK